MPRVKAEHLKKRRDEILKSAEKCFARLGFHRATMHDVIAESGLSAGCLYSYFKSKHELIAAIATDRHDGERRIVAQAVDASDPRQALARIARQFAANFLSPEGIETRRVSVQTWSEALLDPEILALVREGVDGPRAALVKLVRAAQKKRQISQSLDADSVARALIALYYGFILQKLWQEDIRPQHYLKVVDAFVAGLEFIYGALSCDGETCDRGVQAVRGVLMYEDRLHFRGILDIQIGQSEHQNSKRRPKLFRARC